MARVFSPMFQSISAVLILILTFLTVSVPLRSESRYEKMDEYLSLANELWRFNGTVLVADRGEILLCRGYGFSNKDFGQPNTPQTRFFIGSITKQFTAAAILALRDDSLLNLDNPITYYLPDYLLTRAAVLLSATSLLIPPVFPTIPMTRKSYLCD
ncbi:MAG: beta-lactamase family protein [bacterium]